MVQKVKSQVAKLITFFLLFAIIANGFLSYPEIVYGASSPYNVPSSVRRGWDNIYGGKQYSMTSGRDLVYDVYSHKYTKGGYRIVYRDFGKGRQPYLNFQGWAVLFGYKSEYKWNNDTYIVAKKSSGSSGAGTVKIYNTLLIDIDATEDLEYNNTGSGLYHPCSNSTRNKNNSTCNMRYESVGFNAFIPLKELFPKKDEKARWKLFIVKKVDNHIVYTPLILPFKFEDKSYNGGKISLSSGVNANRLVMNSSGVLRRAYPRQSAYSVYLRLGSDRYFSRHNVYTRVASEESRTAIWYGVKSTEDGGKTKWATTAYWTFGGSQAILTYTPPPDDSPPVPILHQLLNYRYKNGNDYWVQPYDQVYIRLEQRDVDSGNQNQDLRLVGSGQDVRAIHRFRYSRRNFSEFFKSRYLTINSAYREKNTSYGQVKWGVVPKRHGDSFNVDYYYEDNAGNHIGYNDTGMNLRVDGVAPKYVNSRLSHYRYRSGNNYWVQPGDQVYIQLTQRDVDSQYLRLDGSGVDVRSQHNFHKTYRDNNQFMKSWHVRINSARRQKNTSYGKIRWGVVPHKNGDSYNVLYYFMDNVDNHRGYRDTGMNLNVDGVAPRHVSTRVSHYRYKSGNNYWVRPNDQVYIELTQRDSGSGNNYQYLRLNGSGVDVRSQHNFHKAYNYNNQFKRNWHVKINSARREKNTSYGKVKWGVVPRKNGDSYNILYYCRDNVDNSRGYRDTGMNLRVDGVAPRVRFRNLADTRNFYKRDWQHSTIFVRLKFSDSGSGYRRSRYAWTQSKGTPRSWSRWTSSSNYVVSKRRYGQWYLHIQTVDNVGNVRTIFKGPYRFDNPPVANFIFQPPKTPPSGAFEGEDIQLLNKSHDPDNNPLKTVWRIAGPNGQIRTTKTWNAVIKNARPGTYSVLLKVTDSHGETDRVLKSLRIQALGITGKVLHTAGWGELHDPKDSPNDFYAGERFVLEADVTAYPIKKGGVTVDFAGKQQNGNTLMLTETLTRKNATLYTGNLYDKRMTDPATRLSNGTVLFKFTVHYKNGVVKTDLVPVHIIGSVYDVFKFHRTF